MSEQINFKHLHYFWAVAHAGGVTRAAEQLGVSTQTVSGQISRLEQSLERTLFRQQGRQLVLTEAGHVALRYADQIFMLERNYRKRWKTPNWIKPSAWRPESRTYCPKPSRCNYWNRR